MTWHHRTLSACDLDELQDALNPELKSLENELQRGRPAIMAGYPEAQGVIVDQTTSSHTGDTNETTLKTFDFGRGALGAKAGFIIHVGGQCDGTVSTKNIKLKWGGETILTLNVQAGNTKYWMIHAEFWNNDTTQDQRYHYRAWDGTTLEQFAVGIISVDTL